MTDLQNENKKTALSSSKLKGKITLSSTLKKEDIMKKISADSPREGIITRKGDAENLVLNEDIGLSHLEKERRMKALTDVENKKTTPQKKPENKINIEMEAVMEIPEGYKLETKHIPVDTTKISGDLLTKKLEVEDIKEELKNTKEEKKKNDDIIIAFKQTEATSSAMNEILKEEVKKIDRRDKRIIEKTMQHYRYIEFDDDNEIKELQKGIELRGALEDKRKSLNLAGSEDEVMVQSSANDLEDEVIKVRRDAFFSRHNKRGLKKKAVARDFIPKEVEIYDKNLVLDIARALGIKSDILTKKLKTFGLNTKETDIIDGDAAELAVEELGHIVKRVKKFTAEDKLKIKTIDENLSPVIPVVTVMGHVDHGKTSLLDALRSANVAGGEAGGITQGIGAYQTVLENGKKITFIDTPGHEAFTSIRARGANITHVIVLVVAADDGVMPQTLEAINHAKLAGVPMVVAINKIDKPGADIQRVKNELLAREVVSDDLGGDVMFVPISAKTGENLEKLCEAILLQAEVYGAKADYKALATGVVLEAKLDKQKGIVATLLIQNGTLKTGDLVIVESSYFKVRVMFDYEGNPIKEAEPSTPVLVYGLSEVPVPGMKFNVVENEKLAKEVTAHRKERVSENNTKVATGFSREAFDMFSVKKTEEKKVISIILRVDAQSTIEAIKYSLSNLEIPAELELKILQALVGSVTEADINLAKTYDATIFTFNTKVASKEAELARKAGILIKEHNIIYNIIDDIKMIVSDNLSPIVKEEVIGEAEVRAIFNITKSGKIAGCIIKKGLAKRNAFVKVFRKNDIIAEGKLKTLKHFKDDVKELAQGNECGIQVEGFEDFLEGDNIQIIDRTEERRSI